MLSRDILRKYVEPAEDPFGFFGACPDLNDVTFRPTPSNGVRLTKDISPLLIVKYNCPIILTIIIVVGMVEYPFEGVQENYLGIQCGASPELFCR